MARTPPSSECLEALRLLRTGLTMLEIRSRLGWSRRELFQALHACPDYRSKGEAKLWPLARREKAVALYAAGSTLAKVAREVGTNHGRLRLVLLAAGVRIRPQSEAQVGKHNP